MGNNQSGDTKQPGSSDQSRSGNFANDPQRNNESGRKGGQQSQQTPDSDTQQQGGSQRGGSGNFANDREKASEAGRKGGEHSQGGSSK